MKRPINAALLLTIGLPAFAIVASLWLVAIAFTSADAALPGEYHWEGMQLDRDFASSRVAATLDVQATLFLLDPAGECRLTLHIAGVPPKALELKLVHGSLPELDRDVRLLSDGGSGYEGNCGAVPAGLWHVELIDASGGWSIHQDVSGALDGARLSATPRNG
jgi:hypothetical protein